MPRPIEFRGRIIAGIENAGEWVYWGLSGTDMLDVIDPETVGQFIGLFDKNGKKVYEKDIVKGRYYTATIKYFRGAFGLYYREGEGFKSSPISVLETHQSAYEIIGNELENPELLEGGN